MRAHINEHCLRTMCRVLGMHRSGYYVWQRQLVSASKREDDRLSGLIKRHWLVSGGVYDYRKVTVDLLKSGEACSRHRVLRLMQSEGLRAEVESKKNPGRGPGLNFTRRERDALKKP